MIIPFDNQLSETFFWLNKPEFKIESGKLFVTTAEETDFWQRTHYAFRPDNGHCLLTKAAGDFSLNTHVSYEYESLYDQCGLIIRADSQNWIKVSVEFEKDQENRLGSVVTNLGYSDWATQDITPSQKEIWYRACKRGNDFLIETSFDGRVWHQLRIAHLHQIPGELEIGLYACSPISGGFQCHFNFIDIADNE